MKRVIIVGGGYAGVALARAMDGVAEVYLIEARDRFVHNVAAIRSVVTPSLLEQILIPYNRLLRHGRVIQGKVIAATEDGVVLSDQQHIEADIVVVATGSHYAYPFKPQNESMEAFAEGIHNVHGSLLTHKKIAIVGGGAVGIELAGEIATAYPEKQIALIADSTSLMPDYPTRFGERLANQLRDKGVSLHLGLRARNLEFLDRAYVGSLVVGDGIYGPRLVVPAIGAKPRTDLFHDMPGATFDSSGRVEVDAWLRPASAQRLFAFGDAAATGDPMTIVAITRQAPWLTKTLKAFLAGDRVEAQPIYKPWRTRGILVPLGPRDGASMLPVLRDGVMVGDCPTAMIKGRKLFIPRYRKDFGYAA